MSSAQVRAVILGGSGQVGRALAAATPAGVVAVPLDRATLDVTDVHAVKAMIDREKPAIILNAAAYTAVDTCESAEAAAFAANATAVGLLADAARSCGALLVHISTDFVFDGKACMPYRPDAATGPVSAYGRSKLAGERAAGRDAVIVRTAWVYAAQGRNFVRTMLRLMAERPEVRVVADQIGTPTYAPGLAGTLWALAQRGIPGIYHFTDSGVASWYDFAVAIQEEALAIGILDKQVPIVPIATADYPTPASRPHFSVLDSTATYAATGHVAPHWRVNLRTMLREIREHG